MLQVRITFEGGRFVVYGHGVMGTPFHRMFGAMEQARIWCLAQCLEVVEVDSHARAMADEPAPTD